MRGLAWVALAFSIALGSAPGAAQPVPVPPTPPLSLSLPEARSLALEAAVQGRLDVALSLTQQLLEQDETDSAAHLARSTAFLNARAYGAAYKGGRLAFRHAETDAEKYQAARVSAVAAMGGEQGMLAQYWMRRAGDYAATEVDRTKIERQFRILQAKTPWSFRFAASLAPSSNVNGGSDETVDVIDFGEFYIVGSLSADAQALSGVVGHTSLRTSYRFSEGARHRSQIEATLFAKRVWLSSEAKDRLAADPFSKTADEVERSLSVTTLDVKLRHAFTFGEDAPTLGLEGGVRQYWQGHEALYTGLSTGVSVKHDLTPRLVVSAGLGYEARSYASGADGEFRNASLGLSYTFANGNRITGAIYGRQAAEARDVFDNTGVTGRLGLALGQPVLGVKLSGGIGVSVTDYPDFWLLGPRPRTDETLFADLSAQFTQIEFAGFSPNLRIRRSVTESNISRYESAQWGLSLGIESNF